MRGEVKKNIFSVFSLVLVFFFGAFYFLDCSRGCSGGRKDSKTEVSDSKGAGRNSISEFSGKRRKILVRAITVGNELVETELSFPGQTLPLNRLVVYPKVAGKLKAVYVDVGSKVNVGDILAEIDDEEYKLQLRRAESALASAQVSLSQAEDNFKRTEKLFQRGAVAEVEFENAKTAYERAKALFDEAKASLELAKKNLEETKIRATISGVVVERNAEVGMVVAPQTPLFTIHGRKAFFVADITEDDARKLKVGMPAEVMFPTLGRRIQGKIQDIFFSDQRNTFIMRVDVGDNVSAGLLGVAYVKIQAGGGISIPYEAVKISPNGEVFVYQITPENTLKKRNVRILKRLGGSVIVEGLEPGEKIVAEMTDIMFDGMEVQIMNDTNSIFPQNQ